MIVRYAALTHYKIGDRSAFLLTSENDENFDISFSTSLSSLRDNTSIRQDSSIEASPFQISSNSISQVSSLQVSPLQISSTQVHFPKVRTSKTSLNKITIPQVGFNQESSIKTTLGKFSSSHIGTTQVSSIQSGFTEKDSLHACSSEICSSEVTPFKNSASQVSTTKIDSSNSDITQTNSIEIEVAEINTETPLPRFVSSEDFLKFNDTFFHDTTPQIINNLNNTATNIWSNQLQTPTLLDIDFQITDLPPGQLAEATITGFNQQGLPKAGTIQIDNDANGVGWFIDPTPQTTPNSLLTCPRYPT